jgi:hypothetical protein
MQIGDPIAGDSNSSILPTVNKAFDIGLEDLVPNNVWAARFKTKTHTGFAGSASTKFTAADTSTNTSAKAVTGSNITIPQDYACRVIVKAIARRSDGVMDGNAAFSVEGVFYRIGAASPVAAGSPLAAQLGFYGDGINYALALGLVGNDVVAVVYGSSGVVEWACEIEYQMVSTP